MADSEYLIRPMTRWEIDLAMDWAADEGWNPGLYDAHCYQAADPGGFLVGLLDGEPIATISAMKYGDSFGFMGFYIVRPQYRGKGYGLGIWQAAMNSLKGRNIGLDGVVAQQENYKKSGFRLAWRNIRYQGTGGRSAFDKVSIVPLNSLPFDQIMAYERPFFPEDRSDFVRYWINQPDCHGIGIMENDRLAGYGVMRLCRSGWKIGPLFADSPALAETLFLALRSRALPSEPVFLDVPETNPAAVALCVKHAMTPCFETARMYTGETPETPIGRIFGVTSFEIG